MAASALPEPGTDYGPCGEPCSHRDCGSTREMAAALCDVCGKPIGYETFFYRKDVEPGESSAVSVRDRPGSLLAGAGGQLYVLTHRRCEEELAG